MEIKSRIRQNQLLRTISEHLVEAYLASGQFKAVPYARDRIIHMDGSICDSLEVILEGTAVVERIDESGDFMVIAELFPDDILGGNLVFSRNPCYPMTVTARTDLRMLEIGRPLLLEICFSNHNFLRKFLEIISDRSLFLGGRLKDYANRSLRERILAYLQGEYKVQKDCRVLLRTSKKNLAARLGVQRTSLSRALQKMREEELIDFDAESITILFPVGKPR